VTVDAPSRRFGSRRFLRRLAVLAPLGLFCLIASALFWHSLFGPGVLSDGDNLLFEAPFVADLPPTLTHPANPELDDPVLVFSSDLLVIRHDLAAGGDGAWNPYQSAGRPLIASQQTAPFFPLTWLAFVFSFWSSAAWIAALKLVLAAGGMYLLARWSRLRAGPAALAAVAFAFSTYMVDQVQFPTSTVMAMVPWSMLLAGRVTRAARPADVLGLIVAIALLLCGGSPEFIAIGAAGIIAVALYELLRAPDEGEAAPRLSRGIRAGVAVAAAIGGFALAAIAIVPFVEYLGLATTVSRGGQSGYPNSIMYGFVFPELWGRPDLAIAQFGPINYLERTAYFGVLPILLALAGLAARRPRGRHLFWAVFTLVAALIALDTPVHNFLNSVPGPANVDLLRFLFLVILGGALLAGFGLQRWLDGDRRERRRMLIVLIIASLLPVVYLLRDVSPFAHLGDALAQLPGLRHSFTGKAYIRQVVSWRWLVLAAVSIVILLLCRRLGKQWTAVLAVGVLAADLVAINYGYNPSIPVAEANPATPPALAYLQTHARHARISGTLSFSAGSVSLQANMAERYGLLDVGSYNFPKAKRWALVWGDYGQYTGDQNDWDPTVPDAKAVLDAFAVRYVVVPHGATEPPGLVRVFSSRSGDVFKDPTALPRAWVAYGWRRARSAAAAASATVASTTAMLETRPVLEGALPAPPRALAPTQHVRFLVDRDEHVRVLANARQTGYLVLDDSYYPGWRATVDGRPAAIVPANGNFRAVLVPAGRHVVDFSYSPASFKISGWLSVLSAVGVLVASLLLLWRRMRPKLRTALPAA
jgi:hypothetical protein